MVKRWLGSFGKFVATRIAYALVFARQHKSRQPFDERRECERVNAFVVGELWCGPVGGVQCIQRGLLVLNQGIEVATACATTRNLIEVIT